MLPEENSTPSLCVLTADIVFTSFLMFFFFFFSKRAETVSEVGRMPCKSCRERPERMGGGGARGQPLLPGFLHSPFGRFSVRTFKRRTMELVRSDKAGDLTHVLCVEKERNTCSGEKRFLSLAKENRL